MSNESDVWPDGSPIHQPAEEAQPQYPDETETTEDEDNFVSVARDELSPSGDFDNTVAPMPDMSMSDVLPMTLLSTAVLVSFMLAIDFVIYGWVASLTPGWVFPGVVAAELVGAIINAWLVIRTAKLRRPTDLQMAVGCDPDYIWVSWSTLDNLRHYLSVDHKMPEQSEHIMYIATRLHPMQALMQMRWSLSALVSYIVISSWVAIITGFSLVLPPVIWIAVLFGLIAWAAAGYLRWHDWYLLVTDKNIVLIQMHPPWLWWLKGSAPRLPLSKVNFSQHEDQGAMGNALGYGILKVDGLSELDVEYNKLEFIRKHEALAKFISMLISD